MTYRRRHGLARLLDGISKLAIKDITDLEFRVFVVDNDSEGSAAALCEEKGERLECPLTYVQEPRRGISYARNRAVECALEVADFIAFLDDDEVPDHEWLRELIQVQRDHDADVVTGPVLSVFHTEVPDWLAEEPAFRRARFPTGTRVDVARTGNVLIRLAALGSNYRFDPRFAFSGGEDTLLFLQMLRGGHSIVWADEALVYEWVPESRANLVWALKRAFRTGNSWSFCEYAVRPSPARRLLRLAKGLTRVVQGLILLPSAIFVGRRGMVRALRYVCLGAGNATGALALRYVPYRQPDRC